MDRKAGLDFKVKIKNFILVRKWIMDSFQMEAVSGDSFMAVKPWLGVVKNSVPTNYKRQKGDNESTRC